VGSTDGGLGGGEARVTAAAGDALFHPLLCLKSKDVFAWLEALLKRIE